MRSAHCRPRPPLRRARGDVQEIRLASKAFERTPYRIEWAALPPVEGGVGIYVRTGTGIDSVKDLRGKKVAYSKGSSAHYYWVVTAKEKRLRPRSTGRR